MVNAQLTIKSLFLVCFVTAMTNTFGQSLAEKELKILQGVYPPNGRHLYDSVYMDETEIANIHYLEYLYYIAKDSTQEFLKSQLPDSTVWNVVLKKDTANIYLQHYTRYPGYRYFPVVGISYEQAVNYNIWRTNAVNQVIGTENFKKKYPKLSEYDYWFEFRLPTKEEWEFAAKGGLNSEKYPTGYAIDLNKGYSFKYATKFDCKDCLKRNNESIKKLRKSDFNTLEDYYITPTKTISCELITSYIYEYKPNGEGLYNMIGNVAEMTSEKGIAKGGSFITPLSEITIKKDFSYTGPQHWLGFRCLAIKHIRKINQ